MTEESDPPPQYVNPEAVVDGSDDGSLAPAPYPSAGGGTTTTPSTTTAASTTTAYEHSLSMIGRGPRRGAFGSSSSSLSKPSTGPSGRTTSNPSDAPTCSPGDAGLVVAESQGGGGGLCDTRSSGKDRDESDSDDDHIDLDGDGGEEGGFSSASPAVLGEPTIDDEEGADCHQPLDVEDEFNHEEKKDDVGDLGEDESTTRGDKPAAPSHPPTDPEPTEMPAPPSPGEAPPSWELSNVLKETEKLIRAVEDVEAVTAKQIFQSLEATFHFQMDKPTKKAVKTHMIVVLEQRQAEKEKEGAASSSEDELSVEASDDGNGGSGDDDGSEAAPSENEDSDDDDDDEYTSRKPRRQKRTSTQPKKGSSKSKKASAKGDKAESQPNPRPSRRIKKDVRVKAMRIHAEALRKRRMEELRVRNEELQVECNEKDQKRAEAIAAKFDTNTEELRVRRLEQRVELLSKLDEKRMTAVEKERGVELDESSSDSEEDDDLEVVGKAKLLAPQAHKPSALSLLAMADHRVCRHQLKRKAVKGSAASPSRGMSARAALKSSLVIKRRQQSNLWLARELGYKSEKEHLKECLEEEQKKQAAIRKLEQERLKRNQLLRERMLQGVEIVEEGTGEGDEEEAELALSDKEEGAETNPEDDDEEQAMAREIEEEGKEEEASAGGEDKSLIAADAQPADSSLESGEFPSVVDDDKSEVVVHDSDPAFQTDENTHGSHSELQPDEKPSSATEAESNALDPVIATVDSSGNAEAASLPEVSTTDDVDTSSVDAEEVSDELVEQPVKPKGPRNAAWKALLEKEAALSKKQKATKNDWVEDEADEEEDEQVAGLEDFGFSIHKKKKDDDENEDVLNEDDLENVVDELSDNEGDEDAGEKARKEMEIREEKERHKEMLRRLRDGYDGRRGGVAGGLGARGVHRFDQLVAADNREDAKRLGLLNDDELESDDEEVGAKPDVGDDEEDEGALIDKLLKDRFLHRSSVNIEEEFSDDDEEEVDEVVEKENVEDDEEKEQERLAKRFAKRARMQRLIEAHGHEEEFSRSRLIDEDTSLKIELQKMKNGLARKRTISSQTSASTSSSEPGKKLKSAAFGAGISGGGSLAIALQASRRNNKTRTTFVRSISSGCGSHSNKDEATTTSFQRCISLSSVVFSANNSNSGFGRTKMAQKASARPLTRPVGLQHSQGDGKVAARANQATSGNSLWSRAIATGYKKP